MGNVSFDGLEGVFGRARALARARFDAVQRDHCPGCTVDKNPLCIWRSSEQCRIRGELEQQAVTERRLRVLAATGIPRIFWRALMDHGQLKRTTALEAVVPLLNGRGKTLVLCGKVGKGKSFAASYVVETLGGYLVNAGQLATYQRGDPEAGVTDPIWSWKKAPALAIDDLGLEPPGHGYSATIFNEILRERVHAGLVTVITSKLTPRCRSSESCQDRRASAQEQCFACRYSENAMSRISGSSEGGLGFFHCTGPTLRA